MPPPFFILQSYLDGKEAISIQDCWYEAINSTVLGVRIISAFNLTWRGRWHKYSRTLIGHLPNSMERALGMQIARIFFSDLRTDLHDRGGYAQILQFLLAVSAFNPAPIHWANLKDLSRASIKVGERTKRHLYGPSW